MGQKDRGRVRASLRLGMLAFAIVLSGCAASPTRSGHDPMVAGFERPPQEARPRIWWHWLNGNISVDGAKRDLEWMHRVGIGGVQVFEGALDTPRVVERPLVWMTPEWREALRGSVETAAKLGLEVQIASSPGWSITGAPFVAPDDAMKKLVWSRLEVTGGASDIHLPALPRSPGPFQDVEMYAAPGTPAEAHDVAVLAFPASEPAPIPVRISTGVGSMASIASLGDGRFGDTLDLPFDPATAEAQLRFDFGKPVKLSTVTIGLIAVVGFGAPPAPDAVVEVSEDGSRYREVARLPHSRAQARAATFDPVGVRYARIRLIGQPGAAGSPPVGPGVVGRPAGPAPSVYRVSEARFGDVGQVHRWIEKAGFAAASDYYALPTPASADVSAVEPQAVVDLTGRLRADGSLDWTPPPGRWAILRMGYTLTGKRNNPAPAEATGLEVDKLDPEAVGRYIDRYLDLYRDAVGPELLGSTGINGVLSDSIESGNQNWTPRMKEAFQRLRGYDPTPWLPVLTGVVVGSAEESDRFLYDYRATISDLLTEAHYGVIAAKLHARGMRYYSEALEDGRPQLGDDLSIRAQADVPMGAMWWAPAGSPPRTTLIADVQGAASVASIYGKRYVGAESLTAYGKPWGFAPADLKATADLEFALGINRIIIHTSAHQPFESRRPGFALATLLGQYLTRNETWADMAPAFLDYLARSSWLMQQGTHAADIAYFIGEEAPVTGLYRDKPFDALPSGYGFDFVGPHGLENAISVDGEGRLLSEGGVRYRLLVLGGTSTKMTRRTLDRLIALVESGATVVGARPEGSPSLADDPEAWSVAADRLWGPGSRGSLGKGQIFTELGDALSALKLDKDWRIAGGADASTLAVRHRTAAEAEIWFVSNRGAEAFNDTLSFRIAGRKPEFWDAVSGERSDAPFRVENGRTLVPVALGTSGSTFIVFREPTNATAYVPPPAEESELARLDAGWTLTLGEREVAGALASWTELPDPEDRYFSGVGIYRRTIKIPKNWIEGSRHIRLDLGTIGDVAEIRINGTVAGTVWTAPYALDVRPLLRPGQNRVEVHVANLWVNRLIGDAQPGAAKRAEVYGPTYRADAPLRPSGLLGPVRIIGVK